MPDQQERVQADGIEIDLVATEEDDLEPLSLEYDDEDLGENDEPVSAQLEPDDPDDRARRGEPFLLMDVGEL